MKRLTVRKTIILVCHALVLWALCGITIAIGRSVTSMQLTLKVHLVAAPLFASIVSIVYFKKFNYTSPLSTSLFFLFFIMAMDAGLVALVFEKSFDMFRSLFGTWIPFALIFLSAYMTGLILVGKVTD
jgi:hypothetical protein